MRGYSAPRLHKGKEWYVDFYAYHPGIDDMKRKKYAIKMDLSIEKRYEMAADMIFRIEQELRKGWNPWFDTNEYRNTSSFEDCMQSYLDGMNPDNRDTTKSSNQSKIRILRSYNNSRKQPILSAKGFTTAFCQDFLEWVVNERGCRPSTRNNYLGWINGFANYLLAKQFIDHNPVAVLHKVRTHGKIRKPLDEQMLNELSALLLEADRPFYLACLMMYYTFIRPAELRCLKISYISKEDRSVFIPKEISKNRKDGYVGLNDIIIELMDELGVFTKSGDEYLFSDGFIPGYRQLTHDDFNRKWRTYRDILGWDGCYKFYSLKDSGIRDLAAGTGLYVAMEQARHSNIQTTRRYIQTMVVNKNTLNFRGSLGLGEEGIVSSSANVQSKGLLSKFKAVVSRFV